MVQPSDKAELVIEDNVRFINIYSLHFLIFFAKVSSMSKMDDRDCSKSGVEIEKEY